MSSPYFNYLIQIAQEELPQLQFDLENASTVLGLQAAVKRMHNTLTYLVHHAILDAYPRYAAAAAAAPRQAPVQAPMQHAQAPYAPPQAPYAPPQAPPTYAHPAPVGHAPPTMHYPHLQPAAPVAPMMPGPPAGMPPLPVFALPGSAPVSPQQRVVDVYVTPTGTRVVPPGGMAPAVVLPPGVPVDAAGWAGATPVQSPSGQSVLIAAPPPVEVFPQRDQAHLIPQVNPLPPPTGEVRLPQGGAMTPEVAAALAVAQGNHDQPPMIDAAAGRNITHDTPPG